MEKPTLNSISEWFKQKPIDIDEKIPAIHIEGYTKKFGRFTANKDVSFNVGHGVIHGFIGPNGSGKTTTIKTIIGAYTLQKGTVLINGNKPGTQSANSLIGYIPERASFPKHLNTREYLVAMGELSGVRTKIAKKRAKDILKNLGLWEMSKRNPTKFSSGMQKKILLAQALMHDPSILILDEPAANLDPTARKDLFDQLKKIRDSGKTILISSHILSELERLIHEVTFLFYGEILYTGTVEDLQKDEKYIFVKTTNNRSTKKILEKNDYKISGDLKTELIVLSESKNPNHNRIIDILREHNIEIVSFRSNDLQTSYDKLIKKAKLENRGNQVLDGEKIIAQSSTAPGKNPDLSPGLNKGEE